MPRTRRLTADLSVQAYDGWRTFAAVQGVTMSALAEALGHQLASVSAGGSGRLPDLLRAAVIDARQIRADRSGRAPGESGDKTDDGEVS